MRLTYYTRSLPFRYPFGISKGVKTHQPTLVVRLEHLGHTGWGEAPAIDYYGVTTEGMVQVLERKRMFVEKFAFTQPERYWHYLHHLLPVHPFLVCALDMAGWDLFGKMKGAPLGAFWKDRSGTPPPTDYTIGIDTEEEMIRKLKEKPWPVYKVKLGAGRDVDIIRALRRETDAPIRVDANAAWTAEEALPIIEALAGLNVELVEQPLAKDDQAGAEWLFQRSPLPIIADESCVAEGDVDRCAGAFHGINIKLTKCSGITPALRMVDRAKALGLKVMLGSMNESSIGSAALAHLAPLAHYLDADGPLLLAEDLAEGLTFEQDGTVTPLDQPGLGIRPLLQ